MSAEAALVPLLTGLVSGRIYPDVAPSGAGLPRIVYQQVGGQAINYTEGTLPGTENARIQVVCWAATRAAAIALMKQAEAAIRTAPAIQVEPLGRACRAMSRTRTSIQASKIFPSGLPDN